MTRNTKFCWSLSQHGTLQPKLKTQLWLATHWLHLTLWTRVTTCVSANLYSSSVRWKHACKYTTARWLIYCFPYFRIMNALIPLKDENELWNLQLFRLSPIKMWRNWKRLQNVFILSKSKTNIKSESVCSVFLTSPLMNLRPIALRRCQSLKTDERVICSKAPE